MASKANQETNVPVNEAASILLGKQKKKNVVEKTRSTSDPETNEGAPILSGKQKKKNVVKKKGGLHILKQV